MAAKNCMAALRKTGISGMAWQWQRENLAWRQRAKRIEKSMASKNNISENVSNSVMTTERKISGAEKTWRMAKAKWHNQRNVMAISASVMAWQR
jgi:phage shock protein A